jgi:hypothetical protein
MPGFPENVSLHSPHSSAFKDVADRLSRATARRAVAAPPGMQGLTIR